MASQVNHFKEFATQAEYEAYIQPDDYAKPLVALVDETDTVMFPQGGGGGGDCGTPIMKSVDVEAYSGGSNFSGVAQITEVEFPAGITALDKYAFYNCASLTSITIPSGVTSIGNNAFDGCSSLTSVTFPSTLTSIGSFAFRLCALTNCDLSGTALTSIGNQAFYGCSALTSIDIPSTITEISGYFLQSAGHVASVTVRATTPPTINNSTFNGTPNALVIYVPAESVETYKTTNIWSNYASKIQAIPA